MAVQTSSTQDFTVSSSAQFHALWGTVFDGFITANGWTYVSQTGDGDPNSVAPGSAGTYACFRLYSTSVGAETWYIRVDFGYTTNGPSLKIQVGSGNNGSGTLTGQVGTQQTFTFVSANLTTGKTYVISAATGRLTFMAAASPSASVNNIWFFGLHGGVNGSGVLTSGMDFLASTVGTTYATQNVPVSGTVPAAIATIPCNQSTLAVNVIGTHTMTFRPFTWNESGGNNPTPALFFGGTTDYPSTGVVVTTQIYAASRNFFATAQTSPISANLRFCLLYE